MDDENREHDHLQSFAAIYDFVLHTKLAADLGAAFRPGEQLTFMKINVFIRKPLLPPSLSYSEL